MKEDKVYKTELGFTLPAESLPTPAQLARLEDGDQTVVNELVEGLATYITNTIYWYVRENPASYPFKEDLVAEALLATLEFLHSSLGKLFTVPALLGFLKNTIEWRCIDWLTRRPTINVPRRSAERHGTLLKQGLKESHRVVEDTELFGEFEFDDFVEGRFNAIEQTIVNLLVRGLTVKQISKELNLSIQKTRNHIYEIRTEFRKEL